MNRVVSVATGKEAGIKGTVVGNIQHMYVVTDEITIEFQLNGKASKGTEFTYDLVELDMFKELEEYEFFSKGVIFKLEK